MKYFLAPAFVSAWNWEIALGIVLGFVLVMILRSGEGTREESRE